jgi:hypothetical protein
MHALPCFDNFGFDENSRGPLTLSFQHVEFNQGGLRNVGTLASLNLSCLNPQLSTAADGTRRP